jgi:hypothetical protein
MNVDQRLARLGELLQRVRERRDLPRHLESTATEMPETVQPCAEASIPLAVESDVVVEVSTEVVEVELDAGFEVEEPVFEAPVRTPPPESGEQEAVSAEPSASPDTLDTLDRLDDEPSMHDEHTLVRGWAEGPAPLPTRPSHGRMPAVRVPAPIEPLRPVSTHPALADTDDVVEMLNASDSGVTAPSTFGELLDESLSL